MITLVLEAATYAGSAALLRDGAVVAERDVAMRGREREALMAAVGELLTESGVAPASLDRIVCGAGPGSFTSLRIAGGIAKGLALATAAPLVPVSSLALLVASQPVLAAGAHLAAIDALRGEHYVQRYEVSDRRAIAPSGDVRLVASAGLDDEARRASAVLVAGGAAGTTPPRASGAARLGELLDLAAPADLAAWEPSYGRLAEAQVQWEAAHGRPLARA